jgi:hypothetical protein
MQSYLALRLKNFRIYDPIKLIPVRQGTHWRDTSQKHAVFYTILYVTEMVVHLKILCIRVQLWRKYHMIDQGELEVLWNIGNYLQTILWGKDKSLVRTDMLEFLFYQISLCSQIN